jgi:hypothetical protein
MAKGNSKTTTTNKNENYRGINQSFLPEQLQNDLLAGLGGQFSNYFNNLSAPDYYRGGATANQKLANEGAANLLGFLGNANNAATDMLRGGSADTSALTNLMGNNNVTASNVAPGLEQAINAATDKALQGVNSQYAASGRLGSDAFGQAAGEGVANAAASVLTPVLTADANRQLQADISNQDMRSGLATSIVDSNFANQKLNQDIRDSGINNLVSLLDGSRGTLDTLASTGREMYDIGRNEFTDKATSEQTYLDNLFRGLGLSDMVAGEAKNYDITSNATETEKKQKSFLETLGDVFAMLPK